MENENLNQDGGPEKSGRQFNLFKFAVPLKVVTDFVRGAVNDVFGKEEKLPELEKGFDPLANSNQASTPNRARENNTAEVCEPIHYDQIYDLSKLDDTKLIPETGMTTRDFMEKQLAELEKSPVAQAVFQKLIDQGQVADGKIQVLDTTSSPTSGSKTININGMMDYFTYVNNGKEFEATFNSVMIHETAHQMKDPVAINKEVNINQFESLSQLKNGSVEDQKMLASIEKAYGESRAATIDLFTSFGKVADTLTPGESFTKEYEINGVKYGFTAEKNEGNSFDLTVSRNGKAVYTKESEFTESSYTSVAMDLQYFTALVESDISKMAKDSSSATAGKDYIVYSNMLSLKNNIQMTDENRSVDVANVYDYVNGQKESSLRLGHYSSAMISTDSGYAKDYEHTPVKTTFMEVYEHAKNQQHHPTSDLKDLELKRLDGASKLGDINIPKDFPEQQLGNISVKDFSKENVKPIEFKNPDLPGFYTEYQNNLDTAWQKYYDANDKTIRDNIKKADEILKDDKITGKEQKELDGIIKSLNDAGIQTSLKDEKGCLTFSADALYQKKGLTRGE